MDANRVALVVSVAALVLTVPLAIAANLLTPRIRDWYSTTTNRRLTKRLAALEAEFESVKDKLVVTLNVNLFGFSPLNLPASKISSSFK